MRRIAMILVGMLVCGTAVPASAQLDEFVLSMNRAAERAAPSAKKIFWDAIGEMTFEDARKILGGGDTAATQYFKGKTGD